MKPILSILVLALLACRSAAQFTRAPPYPGAPRVQAFNVDMNPATTGCSGSQCDVTVTISVPNFEAGGADPDRSPPFPVIFFINGFQMTTSAYKVYANALVRWGYAVVQYQVPNPLLPIGAITDKVELTFLDPLLASVEERNAGDGLVSGILDLDRLGLAGHSRGAKLSTLHFVGDDRVKAVYLIDPVDNSVFSPDSEDFPSAQKALRAADNTKRVGIVGADIIATCNPTGNNFKDFWDAAKSGSWLSVVNGVGHLSFADVPDIQRILCGVGLTGFQETIDLTIPSMINWMDRVFYPVLGSGPDDEFRSWGEEQKSAGKLGEFAFK